MTTMRKLVVGSGPFMARTARLRNWLTGPTGAALTAAAVFLLVWQLGDMVSGKVPGPVAVTRAAIDEFLAGEFLLNFAVSMQRFIIGIALSVLIGSALGLAIGVSRFGRDLFEDINLVGLAIPAVIWALLCTMWFGFGDTAPIMTVVLSGVPFVAVNVAAGARSVSPQLLRMSASFGVSSVRRMRHVLLPSVWGYLFAGIRFAVMSGWNGLLLSEWFGASDGVGHQARYWYDANQMPGFVAWVAFFILFMVVTDRLLLERISRRVFRWRDDAAKNSGAGEPLTTN